MANKSTLLQKMRESTTPAKDEVKKILKSDAKKHQDLKPIVNLDHEGERMFTMVLDYLDETGLLESVDVVTITMLAKNLSMFVMISREILTI